jgi:hypothetical protein
MLVSLVIDLAALRRWQPIAIRSLCGGERTPDLFFCSARGGSWPIAEMPAAARHGRLPGVNLPTARGPSVNPDSAYHGPRRNAGGASIIPPMQQLPLPGDHHRGVELGGEIGGGRHASSPANRRGASSASRSMLTTCRCAGGNAGGAIGREDLDCRHGGEWRRIKPGEPGMPARGAAPASSPASLARRSTESRSMPADMLRPSTCRAAASCPSRRDRRGGLGSGISIPGHNPRHR